MNLIIFGPPGSGKGTYSTMLTKHLGILKISTGDIFRDAIKRGDSLGKSVENFYKSGALVPDEIVNEVFKERILQKDTKNGFILDGYPRTIEQANFLSGITNIDALILIKASKEILVEKTVARRNCKVCGFPWNIANIDKTVDGIHYQLPLLLPRKEGVCDYCGKKLEFVHRADDTLEIVKERLEIYEKQTKPLIDFYKGKIPFVEVWMNRPPDEIVQNILNGLVEIGIK